MKNLIGIFFILVSISAFSAESNHSWKFGPYSMTQTDGKFIIINDSADDSTNPYNGPAYTTRIYDENQMKYMIRGEDKSIPDSKKIGMYGANGEILKTHHPLFWSLHSTPTLKVFQYSDIDGGSDIKTTKTDFFKLIYKENSEGEKVLEKVQSWTKTEMFDSKNKKLSSFISTKAEHPVSEIPRFDPSKVISSNATTILGQSKKDYKEREKQATINNARWSWERGDKTKPKNFAQTTSSKSTRN